MDEIEKSWRRKSHRCSILKDRRKQNTTREVTIRCNEWGCSSAGRAPALQAGGHGFESHHLHQRQKMERRYTEDTEWAHSSGG